MDQYFIYIIWIKKSRYNFFKTLIHTSINLKLYLFAISSSQFIEA